MLSFKKNLMIFCVLLSTLTPSQLQSAVKNIFHRGTRALAASTTQKPASRLRKIISTLIPDYKVYAKGACNELTVPLKLLAAPHVYYSQEAPGHHEYRALCDDIDHYFSLGASYSPVRDPRLIEIFRALKARSLETKSSDDQDFLIYFIYATPDERVKFMCINTARGMLQWVLESPSSFEVAAKTP
jgi:hypothetical protein